MAKSERPERRHKLRAPRITQPKTESCSKAAVHGAQEQSPYNGHFESVCYHPLFVFNQQGDCLAAKLRPGNVPSASGWEEVLLPVIERHHNRERADAAFALPAVYAALEQRGGAYAIRLPANQVLERAIEDLLTRPRGRPSHAPLVRYRSFHYQAAPWDRPRRVIAKVEHHLGELFPRVGFIVTTPTGTNRAVVHFYNGRGTAEQWIKEGKAATHWTRLSCHRFRANEVRVLLGVIAYNLGNLPQAGGRFPQAVRQGRRAGQGRLSHHGRYDLVATIEAPDDVTVTSRLYSVAALGNIRTETRRAFSRRETEEAFAKVT
jgi:hypothetical protein